MQILANNFFLIVDPLRIITSLELITMTSDASAIPTDANINLFVSQDFVGGSLRVATGHEIFVLPIINDNNDEQQLYTLQMEHTGLVSTISSVLNTSGVSDSHPVVQLQPSQATFFHDEFWNQREFVVQLSSDLTVDSVELVVPVELSNLVISVLQSGYVLTILFDANLDFEISQTHPVFFLLHTNNGTLQSTIFNIAPRDPSLSVCDIAGTFFDGVGSEEVTNTTVTFTLRFENFITDEILLRSTLLNMFTVETFSACDDVWFVTPNIATNTFGFESLLNEASVTLSSANTAVVTFGRGLQLQNPQRVTVSDTLPAAALRSARSCPVNTPLERTIFPNVGTLRTVADTTLSEVDFWEGATLTLELDNDTWQDTDNLTTAGLEAFTALIRAGLVSSSSSWTSMITSAQLTLETDASNKRLFVHFSPQTLDTFDISSTIEVSVVLALQHVDGFVSRLSGLEFTPITQHFFVVTPSQSFVSATKVAIDESEVWSDVVLLECRLHNDAFVVSESVLAEHINAVFSQTFDTSIGPLQVAFNDIELNTTQFTITIPQGSPATFNINDSIELPIQIPASMLRNATSLLIPTFTFTTTAVTAEISNVSQITKQDVINGFQFSITLTNDRWTVPHVNVISRQDTADGWNKKVHDHLVFEIGVDARILNVTVRPTSEYNIATIEVVDVIIEENATSNKKRHYVTNFTIQGASVTERLHHSYLSVLLQLQNSVARLRQNLNRIRSNIKTTSTSATSKDFETSDSVFERLSKLNSSSLEHPIAVCAPSTINNISSSEVLAFVTNVQSASNFGLQSSLPMRKQTPILVPSRADDHKFYTLLFRKETACVVSINGVEQNMSGSSAYTLSLSQGDHLMVKGSNIHQTVF